MLAFPLLVPFLILVPSPLVRLSIFLLVPGSSILCYPRSPWLADDIVQTNDGIIAPDVVVPMAMRFDGVKSPWHTQPLVFEELSQKILIGKLEIA
jgi:hypothetical protein